MLLDYHDHIELDGVAYLIHNSHRNYITALKLIRSEKIFEEDKVELVLPLLFKDEIPKGKEVEAIQNYFNLFTEEHRPKRKGEPSFDIVQDADYIYAGFMQSYGMDLDNVDLKIEKFIALLKGLPTNTKLSDIIRIRTMPIPQRTKWNAQQIADIIEAKHEFALDNQGRIQGMGDFGKMIKEWARHGR